MVGALVLTGGALCAGWSIYRHGDGRVAPHWLSQWPSGWPPERWTNIRARFRSAPPAQNLKPVEPLNAQNGTSSPSASRSAQASRSIQTERQDDLLAAAALLGLVAVGGAGVLPLKYVAAPILLYRGFPALQSTVDVVRNDRRATQGILETAALAIVIVNGAWLAGSAGFAIYHLGRWVIATTSKTAGTDSDAPFLVRRNGQERTLLFKDLQPGDWVSMPASQQVPINSAVVEGTAFVSNRWSTGQQAAVAVRVGDTLVKDTIVLAGNLWVEVPA